mmetsp:Transcript_28308/g.66474  ORF Transcript_28308/g.66474 Transcript_28308/m.66474 type:complete len:433 (-) Transcript_28308:532-1830(-)
MESSLVQHPRPIADTGPPLEMLSNLRVGLPLLEFLVRIEVGILVVESDHQPRQDQIRFLVVHKGPTKNVVGRRRLEGKPERVLNQALLKGFLRDLPDLLDAQPVRLGLDAVVVAESEFFHQKFRAGPPGSLRKQGLSGPELDAALKGGLGAPVLSDAHVAGRDSQDAGFVPIAIGIGIGIAIAIAVVVLGQKDLARGESGVDFDSQRLGLLGEPPAELGEAQYVIAVVVELAREQHTGDRIGRSSLGQNLEMVVLDGSRVGTLAVKKDLGPVRVVFVFVSVSVCVSPLFCPLRKELANGLWVKDVSRQDVCANLGSLVNDADREFLVVFEAELLGANGRRQSRGSSPDDQNVKGHALTGFQQFGGNPDVFVAIAVAITVAVAVGFTVGVVRRRRSGRKRSELGVDGAGVGNETVVERAIRFRFRFRSRRRPQ